MVDRRILQMYEDAVSWIALNDEPAIFNPEEIKDQLTVLLVADTFDKSVTQVTHDVIEFRVNEARPQSIKYMKEITKK
jgi:hypothetical protein